MSRLLCITVVSFFILWLLPLGIFIKPSQEKLACDGQRAVCLCTHVQAKAKANSIEGYGLKAGSESKEANASSGAGHYFMNAYAFANENIRMSRFEAQEFIAYRNPFLKSIEHIPKA